MGRIAEFTVFDTARPKGSTMPRMVKKRDAVTGELKTVVTVTHQNRESLFRWENEVRREASKWSATHPDFKPVEGPVAVRLIFFVLKPKSQSARAIFPIVMPDLDKLVRGALDPLSKKVFRDDCQIVHIDAWKVYTEGQSRVVFELWEPEAFVPKSPDASPFLDLPF